MSCTSIAGRFIDHMQHSNHNMIKKFVFIAARKIPCVETLTSLMFRSPVIITRKLHSGNINVLLERVARPNIKTRRALLRKAQVEVRLAGLAWNMNQTCYYSQESDKQGLHTDIKQEHILKGVLQKKKEQLMVKEQKLRETGQIIMKDIRETRDKMKEKMEEVIERENIWTVPNVLCVSRIIASPYLGYLIIQGDYPLALGIFVFAGITDLLDGWIARNFKNQSTKLGSFLDPMADKILVGVLFATLTYVGHISVALTALIIARDLLLVGAGFWIRYKSLPSPRTLSRYFDASLVTAQLQPTFISKVNTVIQLVLVASVMAAPVVSFPSPETLLSLSYITAATTVASGLSYVFKRNTYHILKKPKG